MRGRDDLAADMIDVDSKWTGRRRMNEWGSKAG
jgi:hypothetical protein